MQDGSCNGLQHYAALGRDQAGADAVNLTDAEVPQDVYTSVLNIVIAKVEADALLPENYKEPSKKEKKRAGMTSKKSKEDAEVEEKPIIDETETPFDPILSLSNTVEGGEIHSSTLLAGADDDKFDARKLTRRDHAILLRGKLDRKVIKQTVMTSVYGVTIIGARNQVRARLMEVFFPESKSSLIDTELEGRVYAAAAYVADLTLESLSEMFSSANHIKVWLAECANLIAKSGHPMAWITPLGLPCVQPYRKEKFYVVKTVMQAMKLSNYNDDLPVSSTKQTSAFPPNFVHSLDASHMLLTALAAQRDGLTFASVHDSFWTHSCDIPLLSTALRKEFIFLYESPILENLKESMERRFPDIQFPPIPGRGDFDIREVYDSKYFFH